MPNLLTEDLPTYKLEDRRAILDRVFWRWYQIDDGSESAWLTRQTISNAIMDLKFIPERVQAVLDKMMEECLEEPPEEFI